jgi:O-glycosyl hydrolase
MVAVTNNDNQAMDGFGCTTLSLIWGTGIGNTLTTSQRQRAIEAVYRDVGINLGVLEVGTPNALNGPSAGFIEPENDDDDPAVFNWAGFNTQGSDDMKEGVVDLAAPLGFTGYYIGARVNTSWGSPWLATLRGVDYDAYLDEAAETIAAMAIYWRDAYGISPSLLSPMNEPLTGNRELAGGAHRSDIVDIIKRAGQRLRDEGFPDVKFVVPGEETEETSLATAAEILADAEARQFVGVIAYHTYPYGSTYAGVTPILATSGSGNPDAGRIAVRAQIRDLGAQYGIPVWMTEVSTGGVDARAFDGLRARAIHIHDELEYAGASAYFGMANMWDLASQRAHTGNDNVFGEGNIVVIDNDADTVTITSMGHAIGHYARWIKPGAKRIDAQANSALVLVSAFRDDALQRLVLVAINNDSRARDVDVQLDGIEVAGAIGGEQSTAEAGAWQAVGGGTIVAADRVRVTLPALSVTTVALSLP